LGLIGEESAGNYFSYHFDYRGSTIAITNITGQLLDSVQYSPFGVILSQPTFDTPFFFNGLYGVMTDGNHLNYMRARYYSPEIRRFVNQDVLLGNVADGQSLNRFAFVTGNPVSFVDPFGLERQSLFPSPKDFPKTPSLEVCSYYDRIAKEQGCNYHSYAAQICRGEPVLWSFAANFLLKLCASDQYHIEQIKNCVRTCLVSYDHFVLENLPECSIQCKEGVCTSIECIDAYHNQCFSNCAVLPICYGGRWDNFLPTSWFYDNCPKKCQ
jgi:RHS repeat-associated protein